MNDRTVLAHYRSRLLRNLDMFIQDFNRLPEERLWEIRGSIANSAGVLGKHIVGNLNHFFGHALGGTDYQRQREKEFVPEPAVSKDTILKDLTAARTLVEKVLEGLDPRLLDQEFPAPVFGDEKMNCLAFLFHLYHHLSYHAGQLNYLMRG